MQYFDDFITLVDKGAAGEAVYLPLAGKKLGSKIAIAKSMYVVFGGMPGKIIKQFT